MLNLFILEDFSEDKDCTHLFNMIEKLEYNLIGFLSDDPDKYFQTSQGYMIFPINYIHVLKFDFVLIDCYPEHLELIVANSPVLNIPKEKIKSVYWLIQQFMIKKYEDFQDPVIQETLNYWKNHDISLFNQHMENYIPTLDQVFIDESNNLPYIMFKTVEGKKRRMYFTPDYPGILDDGKGNKFIAGILREQIPTSPHLYITGNHKINYGDVLIDAGVCEGNFALHYVDVCSKVYLFEPDPDWFTPLYFSFRDCWDKVIFIPKAVSDVTQGGNITLDDSVNVPRGSHIFLKMDIEGAEPAALHGAKRILTNNKVKASVCSYHNSEDAVKIKSVFKKYNYKTWASNGYMVFVWDPNIWTTADFRKGIIYAENY